jgi:hypothetical protein
MRRDRLPLEAVRDLLGIARAMYAARQREGALVALPELAEIGQKLKLALKLGQGDPETMGHRAAWTHAEEATGRLMKLITAATLAAPIVEAAAVRLRRLGPQPAPEREEKRAAAKRRN